MADVLQMQVIAHGTVSAANPPVTTLQGVTLAFTNPGVYAFTLDAGLPGDVAVVAANLRTMVTPLSATTNYQVVKTSTTVITVNTFLVDGTTATNKAFDFVFWRTLTP